MWLVDRQMLCENPSVNALGDMVTPWTPISNAGYCSNTHCVDSRYMGEYMLRENAMKWHIYGRLVSISLALAHKL